MYVEKKGTSSLVGMLKIAHVIDNKHYLPTSLILIESSPSPQRTGPSLNETRTYEMRGGEASDLEPKRCAALAICSGLSFFFFRERH